MTKRSRVLFLDKAVRDAWGHKPNRFQTCALEAVAAGFEVTLATVGTAGDAPVPTLPAAVRVIDLEAPPYPLVCGRGRARDTQPLRDAYAVAQAVALTDYDLVVAPLRGGLAHGLLMRRATGEANASVRIALWCDGPSRWLALAEDESPETLAPLVSDALERTSLALADALIVSGDSALERLTVSADALPPIIQADLPCPPLSASHGRQPPSRIEEIVFVGPLSRRHGAHLFMDAIEALAAEHLLGNRLVTFMGPMKADGAALSQTTIGVRAQNWPFDFNLRATEDEATVVAYLRSGSRLAVFAADDADDDQLLCAALRAGCPTVATTGYSCTRSGAVEGCLPLSEALAHAIAAACAGTLASAGQRSQSEPPDWPKAVTDLCRVPQRSPPSAARVPVATVTVCTVTSDRPDTLEHALASIGASHRPTRVLLLDNAGNTRPDETRLSRRCAHAVRVVRSERRLSPAQAYTKLAREADGDALVFLDDDNVFTPSGMSAFISALETGWFDVVVTTLDLVDGTAATGASSGRFVFLGQAASAGLFFNGFGDRAFAIRRDAFLALGGFPDPGHHAPVSDWTFLARAQAAGLRIGVLQEPAIRYARRLDGYDTNWLKRDVEGGRRAVLEAYGDAIDGPLVARFAQGLHLRSP